MHSLDRMSGACALALLLCACGGGGSDDSGGGSSAPGKVTVVNGSADGYTAAGDTVHVFANPSTDTQVFDHWSGDTSNLADAHSWHTTFTLGSKDLNLTAVYDAVSAWEPVEDRVGSNEDFWYHVPSGPRGLILFFHGTGGTGPQWFKDPEFLEFLRQAVARGYGVAALDASDHVNKDWTLGEEDVGNPDIRNVETALNRLQAAHLISSSTPLYAIGFSNGAGFSALFCDFHGCAAQATVSAQSGPPELVESILVPTRFNMNRNDHQDLVDNSQAQTYSRDFLARGVLSEFELNLPSPVYPQRFARVPGLGAADSLAIWQALKNGGFLDAEDFQASDPYMDASNWESVIPSRYRDDTLTLLYISEELDNAYSAHGFYSEHFPRTMRFFESG